MQNPNTPEDEQPVINLTREASAQIKSMIANNPENFGKTLRVYVEGGGCSGMQYGMFFDEKRDDDIVAEFDDVSVIVDIFIYRESYCGRIFVSIYEQMPNLMLDEYLDTMYS